MTLARYLVEPGLGTGKARASGGEDSRQRGPEQPLPMVAPRSRKGQAGHTTGDRTS